MTYKIRMKLYLFRFSSCCFENCDYYALFVLFSVMVVLSDAVKIATFLSLLSPLPYAACQRHEIYYIGKAFCVQTWTGPEGSRRLRLPEFIDNRHMKVARLSTLRTNLH